MKLVSFATISTFLAVSFPGVAHAFAVRARASEGFVEKNGKPFDIKQQPKHALGSVTFSHQSSGTSKVASTTALSSVAAAAAALLPGPGSLAVATALPVCSGLWRTGYAVSYGFGGGMLLAGLLQLKGAIGNPAFPWILKLHSLLYVFYGARLCSFLLWRELRLPVEIHQMKRRDATAKERLKRLPVIAGCSALFFCMAAGPMRVLALALPRTVVVGGGHGTSVTKAAILASLVAGACGFLLAAVGDWYKCKIKARDGKDTLVTTGPFRWFRHPNYTGEMLGWTCACGLAPLLAVAGSLTRSSGGVLVAKMSLPWMIASLLGWAGMVGAVLGGEATAGLEQKQQAKYGGTPAYEEWVKKSWSGPMLVRLPPPSESNK